MEGGEIPVGKKDFLRVGKGGQKSLLKFYLFFHSLPRNAKRADETKKIWFFRFIVVLLHPRKGIMTKKIIVFEK